MKHAKMVLLASAFVMATWGGVNGQTASGQPGEAAQRHIDLAICLDTSNSMDGLIESAKQKLWAVVNELATAKPRPVLRVALYQYGNNGLSPSNGWVQQLCGLTTDLDEVYGKLFGLTTNGGTELVARVVRAATDELEWSTDKGTLRIVFVAGNEPATQDEATYKLQDVCKAAASKGIIVNTVHCGNDATGRQTGWADAARWADGQYAAIDQSGGTIVITTPFDDKLAKLGDKLNETYVSYGADGERGKEAQSAQDKNAAKLGAPAAAERVATKATGLYTNANWDLVDAARDKDFDINAIKTEDLPEEMQGMTIDERRAYVEGKAKERVQIQAEISELNVKRNEHVKQEMQEKGLSEDAAFDAAVRGAVRAQATAAGFALE